MTLQRSFPFLLPVLLVLVVSPPLAVRGAEQKGGAAAQTFDVEGLQLDLEAGLVSVRATVGIKDELLEYLLVAPHGAAHESLFQTTIRPSLINAALLATGVQPGRNASYEVIEPDAPDSERAAGTRILPPEGAGFFLYVAWREADETFLFRVDDLITNLASGRSMRRHRWVFLGSRFAVLRENEPESYLADVEGNLINISFFYQGNTLLTAALPECSSQTIWIGNPWILPRRGAAVELVFARTRLAELPAAIAARLPVVPPVPDPDDAGEGGGGQ